MFLETWNSAIADTHLFKLHPGQELQDQKMKIFCRICRKVFDKFTQYDQHKCAKFFHKKFQIDIEVLENLSWEKSCNLKLYSGYFAVLKSKCNKFEVLENLGWEKSCNLKYYILDILLLWKFIVTNFFFRAPEE